MRATVHLLGQRLSGLCTKQQVEHTSEAVEGLTFTPYSHSCYGHRPCAPNYLPKSSSWKDKAVQVTNLVEGLCRSCESQVWTSSLSLRIGLPTQQIAASLRMVKSELHQPLSHRQRSNRNLLRSPRNPYEAITSVKIVDDDCFDVNLTSKGPEGMQQLLECRSVFCLFLICK